ncbi:RIP metalloprotease RseP [Mesorhizobium sp. B2-5-13]|uniref:RIP metalloprotease RseP n=1 Tax=unclassified Mesorhizobium TaxID=325217 RepID=UPI00112CC2B7|nr:MULTISPECIES: RIP metalloprotease RseP [unclassified Mesorhizobium]TPJ43551.1 RIP metalloprotease RseP [Mesorhizobium sp. B2-6-5]TPJ93268.1 RIP metalloprotease RseP [Mesorhizobium sp. B2-5-13]TPK47048.1 RIP metalloprotease RseP [Mesorhizobium sp. B2-5-5]
MNEILHAIFSTEGLFLGTLVPFLFVLTVVVFVHEMGHYLVGRWCGIGVRAFSIGFGPELIGFNDRHGTRWKLCAIPLGGYVKFVGDMSATSSKPTSDELETLTDQERKVAFHTQAIWKRAATVVAGPLFNFLLTIVVFSVLFASYGRYVAEPMVAEITADSPAAKAGILPGDRFVSVDGSKVETFGDVQRLVSGRAGDTITFVMLRGGKEVTVTATPHLMEQEDALGNKIKVAVIGVVNNKELGQPRLITYTPGGAVAAAVEETGHVIERTGQFLQRFVVGREDKCQLGGPVKIAGMAGKAAKLGFEWLVQLVALLSVGIGILNLLPIPPLDGGHLLFYGVEAVIRRPVSERMMEMAYRAGLLLVLCFMAFVFWNDLFGC